MRELAVLSVVAALGLAFGEVGAAPVPRHLMKPAAPTGLDGTWVVEATRFKGQPVPVPPGGMTIEFGAGNLTTVTGPGTKNELRSTGAVAHDAPLRQLTVTQRRDAGGQIADPNVTFGYALTGDKLTLATRPSAPGKFTAGDPLTPGDDDYVIVLSRAKK